MWGLDKCVCVSAVLWGNAVSPGHTRSRANICCVGSESRRVNSRESGSRHLEDSIFLPVCVPPSPSVHLLQRGGRRIHTQTQSLSSPTGQEHGDSDRLLAELPPGYRVVATPHTFIHPIALFYPTLSFPECLLLGLFSIICVESLLCLQRFTSCPGPQVRQWQGVPVRHTDNLLAY